MEYRLGTCSSCNSQFRVPASFKADRAKCKKCAGVVELGPVVSSAEPAAARPAPPAAKPAPEPAAMASVEPIPVAPPPPAPRPVPAKPVAARPAAPTPGPAPKPAPAAKAPAPKPLKPAAEKAVEAERKSVREAAAEAASRVQAAGVAPKRHGSARSGARHGKRRETKSKTGVLIGTAAAIAGAIGIGWFLFGRDEPSAAQAAESVPAAAVAPAEDAPAEVEATPQPAEAPAPELAGEGSAPATAPDSLGPPGEEVGTEPAAEPAAAEAPEPAPEITGVDLATLAPFGKLAETADADWVAYQELAATFIDPAAGAEGNRARAKLLAAGYQAIPAIVNEMLAIDVATMEGYRTGDLLQKLLMEMCRGSNFGWKYSTSAEDQAFNQKVVQAWHKAWAGVAADRKAWIQLGKLTKEEGEQLLAGLAGAPEEAPPADAPEELEDF